MLTKGQLKVLFERIDESSEGFMLGATLSRVNYENKAMRIEKANKNEIENVYENEKEKKKENEIESVYEIENENKKENKIEKENKKEKKNQKENKNENEIKKQSKETKIDVKTFHDYLGHPSEETTKKTAKYYNIQLTGKLGNCMYCALGKRK